MTDVELKKRGYPKDCASCNGFGWYKFGNGYTGSEVRMSKEGARAGFRTKACKVCSADPHPKGQPNEPIGKRANTNNAA